MPNGSELDPSSLLGQALYALVEAALDSEALPLELSDRVAEVRRVVEGHLSEGSLQDTLAEDLDILEINAELREPVRRLRRRLSGARHVPRTLATLHILQTMPDGFVTYGCPGCGKQVFRLQNPDRGEFGEKFSLRRRCGLGETMWRYSAAGGLPSLKGVTGAVICTTCSLVFDADTGTEVRS